MKNCTKIILSIFLFFSIVNFSFAKENYGYMGNLLNIKSEVEEFRLEELKEIKNINFKKTHNKNQFKEFKIANKILKDEIIKLYKADKINYNSMNYIVTNYELFIYHINKVFLYRKFRESLPNDKEIENAIEKNLILTKSYYLKIRNTINRSLKK